MSKRPKQKKLKPIPKFASDEEAGAFWMTHDTTDYIDWSKGRKVSFPNLKPSTETISLRLPLDMLDQLRALANQRDVPYQSLLKVYLADRISEEKQQYRTRRRKPTGAQALQSLIDELELLRDVRAAEEQAAAGKLRSQAVVAKRLRKKVGG